MKDIINLYVLKNTGCPKCKILKDRCLGSKYINNSDFEIIEIDISNRNDSNYQLLIENKIQDMPVLLINNTFYSMVDAMHIIENRDKLYEC